MANPTTNFGWVMPTSTDLVTDLPADFNVFGQGVDTTMADLKGGTTGQILSKATSTDMDFVWIANDQGDITGVTATSPLTGGGTSGAITVGIQDATTGVKGAVQLSDSTSTTSSVLASTPTATKSAYDLANAAIAKSTVTTAGDIIYRNATVPTRLGIGTAGQVLKVNSGATAPEWGTASAGSFVVVKAQTSFSNVATTSTTFDSIFTSTYSTYLVVIDSMQAATASDALQLQFLYSGTATTSGYYGSALQFPKTGTTLTITGSSNTAQLTLAKTSGGPGTGTGTGFFYVQKAGINDLPTIQGQFIDSYSNGEPAIFGGSPSTPQTYTGFRMKSASTNITGTITVYGLVKS